MSAGSCSQTQVSEVGRLPPPTPSPHTNTQRLHCQLHLSILTSHHHHSSSSSFSFLLQTLGHQPCRDTVIYTFYFYFSTSPSFLYRHRSNMMSCHHRKKKKKPKNIRFLQLLPPQPATFHSPTPPPPFDPSTPKSCLSSIYCPLPLSPHPQPPPIPSHHTRSVPVCLSRLSVTPCLQLLAQSEILQQESAATALALSLSPSTSLSHTLHPAFCW